ncbi:MAG: FAD-dependent oxidoreductase [Pseudomonadota bacterium]
MVGAGQAGASLAMRLRAKAYDGAITVFGEEPYLPYQRPPLSKKYLSGEWESDRLYLRSERHWQEAAIEICTGDTVTAIDLVKRTLTWRGKGIRWDKLALTTGARPRPRPPGFEGRSGVFELRSLADVNRIRAQFATGQTLLVIGGGFIGLETAAVAIEAGLAVTVIEQADRILERVVCRETADYFRDLHRSKGVRILEGSSVSGLVGGSRVEGVELADGETLDADLVLLGIGVVPNVELAQAAGLQIENGILVDQHGRTSEQGIWAAGDCAAFPLDGKPTRLESVQNAIDQSEAVADDMLGLGDPYEPVPWFWSDQYDVKLQIAGLNRGHTEIIGRASRRGQSYWYFRNEALVAVDAIGDAQAFMIAKRLIGSDIAIDPAQLADAEFDLKSLLS